MKIFGRLAFIGIAYLSPLLTDATASDVIISNRQQGENFLPLTTVRAIFLMRLTQWSNGESIKVFVLPPNNPIHDRFCKNVLNVFPYQYQGAIDRLVYSGTGQGPIVAGSPEKLRDLVANTPGSIGYLNEELVDESVKRVSIR